MSKSWKIVVATLAAVGVALSQPAPVAPTAEQPDPYQWLEEVSSPRSLAWVHEANARSASVLQADPRFSAMRAAALKVLESPDRLPTPDLRGDQVYNQWQDATHVQGILRHTSLQDYLAPQPHWQTTLDYDALSKADHEEWVAHGLACLYPGDELCMVAISSGGEDASTLREFNLKTGKFVEGGFVLPRSKQSIAWLDKDTLLVARDWGPGTMTTSGYPFVIKMWKRGQALESAKEIFRATEHDTRVVPAVLNDAQGHRAVLLVRALNFFQYEVSLLTPAGAQRLAIPLKSDLNDELVDGRAILNLNEDWKPAGSTATIAQGSLVSLDIAALANDPSHPQPTLIFAPSAKEYVQRFAVTQNHLLVTTLDNVQGRAYVYSPTKEGSWSRSSLPVPENQTVRLVTTSNSDDHFFLQLEGFLNPSALTLGDAATGELKQARTLPPQFDATRDVVEQFATRSSDGTLIPYFVVHRKDIRYDGSNPTILSAYGGFQLAQTPFYDPVLGKLWIENGGVYVLANIRGGGEFGPAWHEAGLTTHRQRIYDDFAAVGCDLVARKITTPRRLGISGGSNGGLLVGVEMTQHPEMWNAVAIMVPLLDMLRFEHIAAGASWVGEYGSVSNPDERMFLASVSPYNQLRPGAHYPEPFIYTNTKDDRVGPVHARKFAARMQEFHEPFYYDEVVEGGHSGGANLKEAANTAALENIYFTRKLMD